MRPAPPVEQTSAEPPATEPERSNFVKAGAAQPAEAEAATPPTFDIVRVEPDGTAVIAGRAPANAEVSVMSGDTEIARERASASGEFVAVPDKPLAVGDHQIRIDAHGPEAIDTASAETAIVSVPPKGHEGGLLVMLERPNEASRFIEVPAEAPAAEHSALKEADRVRETGEGRRQASAEPQSAVPASQADADEPSVASPGEQAGDAADVEPPESRPVGAPDAGDPERAEASEERETGLGVEAVEIEGGMFYVAGSAPPGSTVRLYVDDQFVADAGHAEGNRFLLASPRDISVGPHTIRADAVRADGTVIARVEVPFDRPAGETMTAMEASPAQELASDETASNEVGIGGPAGRQPLRSAEDQGDDASAVAQGSPLPGDEAASTSSDGEMRVASAANPSQKSPVAPSVGPVQTESSAKPLPAGTETPLASAASPGAAPFVPAEPADMSAKTPKTADVSTPTDRSLASSNALTASRPAKAVPASRTSIGVTTSDDALPAVDASDASSASERPVDLAASAMPEVNSMRHDAAKPVWELNKDAGAPPEQSAPKTVVQARLKPVNARVIIRRGDTLWRISKNAYGLGSRYSVIYLANGDQIRNPHRIYPGQVFRMPGGRMAEGRKVSEP